MAKPDTVSIHTTSPRPLIAPAVDRVIVSRNERPGSRLATDGLPLAGHEEILVVDDRAALRPAQVVESKLTRLLQEASLPVSHLQMRGLLRTR
ncbi:MAG: hypothetical protein ACLQGP_03925 [Isosphaeraceae bacterium]